jgi:3-dehydroquinate synthase
MPDNVTVTDHLAEALAILFQDYAFSQVGVVVDENTERHCYPLVQSLLPTHTVGRIRSGERHKNLTTCTQLWEWMTEAHFDRQALVLNLGGGVIGDMGGFCAATYKRGIRFVNLPTTLLSQVDASVGGKLGIDFQDYKNHIGLFQDPLRVMIHPKFLETLPPAELRSGFAEVIKHGLITDANYWRSVKETPLAKQDWSAVIARSVHLKANVVAQDFREGGVRKILNFGHTIGHAVESYYLETDTPLLHGEAVVVGMIAETYRSQAYTGLPADQATEIVDFLLSTYGYRPVSDEAIDPIVTLAQQDKKNTRSQIQCTLLEQIGAATFDVPITAEDIRGALAYHNQAGEALREHPSFQP